MESPAEAKQNKQHRLLVGGGLHFIQHLLHHIYRQVERITAIPNPANAECIT